MDDGQWVERMFPEPVDHGIAQPDRAVTNVRSGTESGESGGAAAERWYEGGGRVGERARRDIVVYPPTRGLTTQGAAFEPVKIGILVDMDIGQLLADWLDPTILAVEEAMNEGVYDRPVKKATGTSPRRLSGTPTTAASLTAGDSRSTSSTSPGKILLPPRLMTSPARPSIQTNPSVSTWAMSPVST